MSHSKKKFKSITPSATIVSSGISVQTEDTSNVKNEIDGGDAHAAGAPVKVKIPLQDRPRRVVFVKNVPLEASKEEIEHYFSEIGPVRRCLLIKEKESGQSRGIAYVHL
jgi:nucleolar protein 4